MNFTKLCALLITGAVHENFPISSKSKSRQCAVHGEKMMLGCIKKRKKRFFTSMTVTAS